jgi:hypothetical protein
MEDKLQMIKNKIEKLYNELYKNGFPKYSGTSKNSKIEDEILDIKIDLVEWDAWITGTAQSLLNLNEVKWENKQMLHDIERVDKIFKRIDISKSDKTLQSFSADLISYKNKVKAIAKLLINYKTKLENVKSDS